MTWAIIGAGGMAREMRDMIIASWPDAHIVFIVDPEFQSVDEIDGVPVRGFDWLAQHDATVVGGVGLPQMRRRLLMRVAKCRTVAVIHPTVTSGQNVRVGDGTAVAAGVSLTSDIQIGRHVIVNPHVTIGHDVRVGDYVSIMPGVHLSGGVSVDEGAYIGVGAVVLEKVRIGAWSVVGAGCVVLDDVPANSTVVGVPGRVIKVRPDGWHQ